MTQRPTTLYGRVCRLFVIFCYTSAIYGNILTDNLFSFVQQDKITGRIQQTMCHVFDDLDFRGLLYIKKK